MNLSTGRAVIGKKVDCWMTHEEYEKISQLVYFIAVFVLLLVYRTMELLHVLEATGQTIG